MLIQPVCKRTLRQNLRPLSSICILSSISLQFSGMKHCTESSQDWATLPSTHMKLTQKSRIIGTRKQEQNGSCCVQSSMSWIPWTVTCVQQPWEQPRSSCTSWGWISQNAYKLLNSTQSIPRMHQFCCKWKLPRTCRTLCTQQEHKWRFAKEKKWLKSIIIRWCSYLWFGQAELLLGWGEESKGYTCLLQDSYHCWDPDCAWHCCKRISYF